MTRRWRCCLLVAFLSIAAPTARAQMYKCVDERGVTHYTESPRPGCKGGEVDIRPIPPVSGSTAAPAGDVARDNADFKRRQVEREAVDAKEKAQRAERTRQCARDREMLARLDSPIRIVTEISPAGEKSYLDDATRQKRIGELREKVAGCS